MTFELHHISHSAANKYLQCGERYRLERVEHHYGLPHMAAIGGSAFHNWTEEFDNLANPDPRFTASFESLFEEGIVEATDTHFRRTGEELALDDITCSKGEGYEWWKKKGADMTTKYVDWRTSTGWECVEIEYRYEQELGLSVPAVGFIDREFITGDGKRILVDIKSGKRIGGTPQLFEYAVIRRLQGVKIDLVAYYDARKGILLEPEDPTTHTVAWLKNYYGNVIDKIQSGIFRPAPGIQCKWCPVRDICAFKEGK